MANSPHASGPKVTSSDVRVLPEHPSILPASVLNLPCKGHTNQSTAGLWQEGFQFSVVSHIKRHTKYPPTSGKAVFGCWAPVGPRARWWSYVSSGGGARCLDVGGGRPGQRRSDNASGSGLWRKKRRRRRSGEWQIPPSLLSVVPWKVHPSTYQLAWV